MEKGEQFTLYEGEHVHTFEWLPFENLENAYFYPVFLKKAVFDLPEHFTLMEEHE